MITVKVLATKYYNLDDADEMMLALCFFHNMKINAIKYLRTRYSYDLKEAKDIVLAWWDIHQETHHMHWSTKYLCETDANKDIHHNLRGM